MYIPLSHSYTFHTATQLHIATQLYIHCYHTATHCYTYYGTTHSYTYNVATHATTHYAIANIHLPGSATRPQVTQFMTVKWIIYVSNTSNTLQLLPDFILSGEYSINSVKVEKSNVWMLLHKERIWIVCTGTIFSKKRNATCEKI